MGTASLRDASDNDLELLMAWRSNPIIYCGFYFQDEPLRWGKHYTWWKSRCNRKDWIIVLEEGGHFRDVGSVNVSSLDSDIPEVGYFVGEVTLWGKGIGRQAVSLAVDWLKSSGYKKVRASILKDNLASMKLVEALGFRRVGEGRKGEWVYEMQL